MAADGAWKPSCAETGLSVPECCCRRCLETMLREHSPALIAAEIRITATADRSRPRQHRKLG